LGLRDAHGLALAAVDAVAGPRSAVTARGLQTFAAELAGAVGPHEGGDDQVAASEPGNVRAEVLDDAEELVPDALSGVAVRQGAVGPQVAAADAGAHDPDQGVGGLSNRGVGDVLDADVARAVDDGSTHGELTLPSG